MLQQDAGIAKRAITGILSRFDYEKRELDQRCLKELRLCVRKNDQIVPIFVDRLFEELHKEDCDRRLGVLMIADYFFQRSHSFRTELVEHIQDFALYTIETDPLRYPLPGSSTAAALLKNEALKVLKSWLDNFERGYTKLKTAAVYLQECKHFNFAEANAQLRAERARAEEARRREEEKSRKLGEKVKQHFHEARSDIEQTLTECRSTISLLFPNLYTSDDSADQPSTLSQSREQLEKLHGYKADEKVPIVIDTANIRIEETSHNADLITTLRDNQVLLTRHRRSLDKWLKKLTEAGAAAENAPLIRQLLDYKTRVIHELKRGEQLKIARTRPTRGSDDSESEGEFEEVVKEGLELEWHDPSKDVVFDDEDPTLILQRIERLEQRERKATLNEAQGEEPKPGPSGWSEETTNVIVAPKSKSSAPAVKVPRLRYDLDLKYFGQDVEPADVPRNEFEGRAYWSAVDPSNDARKEVGDVYKTRQMTFITERPIIEHRCRAPLSNGKLCPRQDMESCPFHGSIVPRDELGFPIKQLDEKAVAALNNAENKMRQKEKADEEEYVRDVEAAVGVSLEATDRRGKRRLIKNKAQGTARKREKTQTDLTRERLQSKLFNKRSMKRVADSLNTAQQQQASKNFANQFNYAITRR